MQHNKWLRNNVQRRQASDDYSIRTNRRENLNNYGKEIILKADYKYLKKN